MVVVDLEVPRLVFQRVTYSVIQVVVVDWLVFQAVVHVVL
jgi:hypothetical protein